MDRNARKARRKKIADAISSGISVESVMNQFDISISHLRIACRENNVEVPKNPRGAPKALVVLGRLLKKHKTTDIIKELGCRRQYIHQVKEQARAAGIAI